MKALIGRTAASMIRAVAEFCQRATSGPPRFWCGVCRRGVRAFWPLPATLEKQLHDAGWKYRGLDDFETCNVRRYSCPHCGSADRDRLVALGFARLMDRFAVDAARTFRIIDFAPMPALSARLRGLFAERQWSVQYRTADLYAPGVDDRIDVSNMPAYGDSTADAFVCSHVLEHVPDDRAALRELYRILKPGGFGILLVPILLGIDAIDEDPNETDRQERIRRFAQGDHVRLYSRSGFLQRVRDAEFVVMEMNRETFGDVEFDRQGIAGRSVLYIVEK